MIIDHRVTQLHDKGSELVNDQLLSLAGELHKKVYCCKNFFINGWSFNIYKR